ncbi:MAG: glycosyltransferase, partial [Candidatus Nanoarchaeia archaeon]
MEVIIVIPTYNEANNIKPLVEGIAAHFSEDYKVFFIDDASADGTADIVKELSSKYPIQVFSREGARGLGSAYIYGFKKAIEEKPNFIMSMDADLSHQPKDLPRLLAAAREGADVVLGSRYVQGGGVTD